MKKFIVSLLVVVMAFAILPSFAEEIEDGTYDVPVHLKNFYEEEDSMGNPALRKTLRAVVKGDEITYTFYTSKMVMGVEGRVTNFFVYTDYKNKKRVEATKKTVDLGEINEITVTENGKDVVKKYPFDKSFTFTYKNEKLKMIPSAMWIDAMDIIMSKGTKDNYKKGAGEKKAYLVIDWAKAKKATVKPNDMTEKHWAYKAVSFVMTEGYFRGDLQGNFMAENSITRGQFLTVLGRIAKVDQSQFKNSKFKDVKEGKYYTPYVIWATENNLYHNDSKTMFYPDKDLNREEMAYILNEYIKLTGLKLNTVDTTPFKDEMEISSWAKDAVNNLAKLDVIHGSNNMFDPNGAFNRAQVAQVLYNIYSK